MREVMTVFAFTLRDNIRKKTFIVTTVIVLILIFAACSIPALIGSGDSDKNGSASGGKIEKNHTCYVIDSDNLVPGALDALADEFPDIRFTMGDPAKLGEYKKIIETDKSVAALEFLKGQTVPTLRFTVTDFMTGVPVDRMKETVRRVIVDDALSKAGVAESTSQLVLTDIPSITIPASKMDITGYALGIVLTMIIFFAIYFYGYGVAMSVASEKTSRVMETLIVSTKPSRILLGKCIAMGTLGLIQLSIFILAAALGYNLLIPDDFTISGVPLALSSFTPASALLILVYFLLGYALFAMSAVQRICSLP